LAFGFPGRANDLTVGESRGKRPRLMVSRPKTRAAKKQTFFHPSTFEKMGPMDEYKVERVGKTVITVRKVPDRQKLG